MRALPQVTEQICVGEYSSNKFARVLGDDLPVFNSSDEYFAVFDTSKETVAFCGLVTKDIIIQHPHLKFRELIKCYPQVFLNSNMCVHDVMHKMLELKVKALPVLDDDQIIVGVIELPHLLTLIYEYQINRLIREKVKQEKINTQLKIKLKDANTQITKLTERDLLTGVANFTLVQQQIKTLLDLNQLAILMLGIDNFNVVNRKYGLAVGDKILQMVSERIKDHCREEDFLGRKDSDTFVIALCNTNSVHDLSQRTRQLLKALAQPFFVNDNQINISASVGISLYPTDAQNTNDLLTCANIALGQAKVKGKNIHQYYSKKITNTKMQYMHAIQEELSGALQRKEFFIYYQPQVNVKTLRIEGVEALIRWKNPRLGMVSPVDFIPIAEKTGLIIPIGRWMLHNACKQVQCWQNPDRPLRLSVNVSALQLQTFNIEDSRRFINRIQAALKASSFLPELLELELTEGTIIRDSAITKKMLNKIRKLGIHISCDDFGMGYSSFNRIKGLPFDTIKFDKSLIDNIHNNSIDTTFVRAMIAIAEQLNIKTIAEGVENKEQFNVLRDMGCNIIQGYYFGKPMSPDEIDLILKRPFNHFAD